MGQCAFGVTGITVNKNRFCLLPIQRKMLDGQEHQLLQQTRCVSTPTARRNIGMAFERIGKG